ncbi:MAG: membrane protein [Gammaproteobacteria bacterium (ex Lamellibrachia satsuma)]|nr:MAG: membrane protein [Gammaproteobacteria bacterium (ex Lamellibrachia satsuma)]RRS35601.1 MAG: membrane protein [Gammaproteobacteria bacterium (ex Lamellibrachia satsuma)]
MWRVVKTEDILTFWYSNQMSRHWFSSTAAIDAEIVERFETIWSQAASGELTTWLKSPEGCLALAIILDQFPLNMFRGEMKSFSTERQALEVAHYAVDRGFDRQLPKAQVSFLYMPLMHSEELADQELSVSLFEAAGLTENTRFARHHRELIRRFGRFPHRNAIINRKSTTEELDYLASPKAFNG